MREYVIYHFDGLYDTVITVFLFLSETARKTTTSAFRTRKRFKSVYVNFTNEYNNITARPNHVLYFLHSGCRRKLLDEPPISNNLAIHNIALNKSEMYSKERLACLYQRVFLFI